MSLSLRWLRAAPCVSFLLPLALAVGCSDAGTVTPTITPAIARGNWQIGSSATAAARFPVISGEINVQANTITGIFHTQSAGACVAPAASFDLAGTEDANKVVTLSGALDKGTLTITGTLAADGKSLTNATYNVVGGACALNAKVNATAQAFTAVTGNYAGNFADADGQVAQVTANFSQSSTPDANGNFTLAGTATVSNNPCFPGAVPVSNTQVTGGTFTFTYAANGNSVTANGTFSTDASTLTVTNWVSSGTCGADTGVQSTMARQGS